MSDASTIEPPGQSAVAAVREAPDFEKGPPVGAKPADYAELLNELRNAAAIGPSAMRRLASRLYVEEVQNGASAALALGEEMRASGHGDKWAVLRRALGEGFELAIAENGKRLARMEAMAARRGMQGDTFAWPFNERTIEATRACAAAFGSDFDPQSAIVRYAANLQVGSSSLAALDYRTEHDDEDEIVMAAQEAAKARAHGLLQAMPEAVAMPAARPVPGAPVAPLSPVAARPSAPSAPLFRVGTGTYTLPPVGMPQLSGDEPPPVPPAPRPKAPVVPPEALRTEPPAFPFVDERKEPTDAEIEAHKRAVAEMDDDSEFSELHNPRDISRFSPSSFNEGDEWEERDDPAHSSGQAAPMFLNNTDAGLYVGRQTANGIRFSFYPTDGRGMNSYDLGGSGVNRLRPEELAKGVDVATFHSIPAETWRDQMSDTWDKFKAAISRHANVYKRSVEMDPLTATHAITRERTDGGMVLVCKQGGLTGCHPEIGPAMVTVRPDGTTENAKFMFRGTDLGHVFEAAVIKLAEAFPQLTEQMRRVAR